MFEETRYKFEIKIRIFDWKFVNFPFCIISGNPLVNKFWRALANSNPACICIDVMQVISAVLADLALTRTVNYTATTTNYCYRFKNPGTVAPRRHQIRYENTRQEATGAPGRCQISECSA